MKSLLNDGIEDNIWNVDVLTDTCRDFELKIQTKFLITFNHQTKSDSSKKRRQNDIKMLQAFQQSISQINSNILLFLCQVLKTKQKQEKIEFHVFR
jgi:hypothetical protein